MASLLPSSRGSHPPIHGPSFSPISCSRNRNRRRWALFPSSNFAASIIFSLILASALVGSAQAVWFFPQKRFQYQGLIDAGDLGLTGGKGEKGGSGVLGGGIVAWGDWDGDQFLDAFTLSADHRRLEVRLWDHANFKFSSAPLFDIIPSSGNPIVNAAPADYDHDGRLDVLIMTQRASPASSPIEMELWLGRGKAGVAASQPIKLPAASGAQPMLADGTGDMRMDLFGRSVNAGDGATLEMWENVIGSGNATEGFTLTSPPFQSGSESPCQLATPHSSAFIDLNGDCLADLFLVCSALTGSSQQRYQIWTALQPAAVEGESKDSSSEKITFAFARSGLLPQGAGPLSFADMDRDGTIDVVFASCPSGEKDCYLNIVYNKQVGLCDKQLSTAGGSGPGFTKSWKDWWYGDGGDIGSGGGVGKTDMCRRTEDLCVADDNFAFDFEWNASSGSHVRMPLASLLPGHRPLLEDRLTSSAIPTPAQLVVGDFNKDGYPDILLLSTPPGQGSDGTGKSSVHILSNVRCSLVSDNAAKSECGKASTPDEEGRWFTVVKAGAEALLPIDDVRAASWVDIDDDGTLDLLLLRGDAASRDARRVTFIQNNFFYDAFFLKSLCLNGACSSSQCRGLEKVPGSDEGDQMVEVEYKPWGASLPGASYKFTVLDPNGNRRSQQVGQQPQSSYRSLLTPYSYFGLGRTNNYVEKLFVGSTISGGKAAWTNGQYFLAMEGLIPNSQLVIAPFLTSDNNGEAKSDRKGDGSGDGSGSGDDGTSPRPETQMKMTLNWHRELYLQPGDWIPWVTLTLVTLCLGLCGFVVMMHVAEKREDERERKRGMHAINFDALG